MYCPEVKSDCIKRKCASYKVIINIMYCRKCKEEFNIRTRCKCGKEGTIEFSRHKARCLFFNTDL